MVAAARNVCWTRISCFGHNLHLGVTKALDNDGRCERVLGIARKIVHFGAAGKGDETFP